jgi:hypothetical protein
MPLFCRPVSALPGGCHESRIFGLLAIATFSLVPGLSRAATPTLITLVNFCALANCVDGANPFAGLIADLRLLAAGGDNIHVGDVQPIRDELKSTIYCASALAHEIPDSPAGRSRRFDKNPNKR